MCNFILYNHGTAEQCLSINQIDPALDFFRGQTIGNRKIPSADYLWTLIPAGRNPTGRLRSDSIRSDEIRSSRALAVCSVVCRWQGPSWNYERIRSEKSAGLTRIPLKQEEEQRARVSINSRCDVQVAVLVPLLWQLHWVSPTCEIRFLALSKVKFKFSGAPRVRPE